MKTRALIFATAAHAGLIGLACAVTSTGIATVQPRAAVVTDASISRAAETWSPSEAKPVEYPEQPVEKREEADRNPLELDASDVLPKFEPKPEPVAPRPVTAAEPTETPTPHATGHFIPKAKPPVETSETLEKPVQQPIANDAPVREAAAKPAPKNPGPPQIQLPPRVIEWTVPPDVRRGFRGRIVAVIDIDAEGNLTSIRLDACTGNENWDRLLRNAFRKAEYKPATLNGKPIASTLRQPVDFE